MYNDTVAEVVMLGVLATALMDIVQYVRHRVFHNPWFDFRLLGRAVLLKIAAKSPQPLPVTGEFIMGWGIHYVSGVALAALAHSLSVPLQLTTLTPAFCVGFGLLTVVFPFLTIQPLMGLGFAASNTPNPWLSRYKSCVTHVVFGCSLYLASLIMALIH